MASFIMASTAFGVCSQSGIVKTALAFAAAVRKSSTVFVSAAGRLGIVTALCVAIGFIFLGEIIFDALGITDADFQVAGGLILLGLAGRELLSLGAANRDASDEFGIVPLGMPLIAGPALLTALLILVDTVGLVFTLVSLLVHLALLAVAFWNADWFTRWMGRQGLRGVSKIVALLLAAIAVSLIRRGWNSPA